MNHLFRLILGHLDLWTALIALLCGVLQVRRCWSVGRWSEATLLWIAFWVMGICGLYGFTMHLVFGQFIAEQIGWPNSPFQYEVAYANLTIGILGLSSFWFRRRDYLVASMVAYVSWFFADGLGHIYSLVVQSNHAPSNAGTVMYTDLLTPILVMILLWLSRQERYRLKS